MADILIKNMEMPKKCFKCPFRDELFCLASDDREINPYRGCQTREKYCPLIELPPHGDLKDVDKVITEIKGWYCEDVYAFIHELEIAPTVLPASEGE